MFRQLFAWMSKYERHLSAAATILGAVIDQIFFGRVDLPLTQFVFQSYIVACVVSISLLQWFEVRGELGYNRPRWRSILPLVTQFSLGGFWSGFVVFYGRAAVFSASWPFLLFLGIILIGNEVLKKYHERLVFTSVLFFFALYSYAIFAVPIYVGTISTLVFLESGLAAIIAFTAFTILLRLLAHSRIKREIWRIRVGAFAVLVIINGFYFAGILPPLPLALKDSGIYHLVVHDETGYHGSGEPLPWYSRILGRPPTEHVSQGESLYAYSAVFAPVALATTIVHEWQWRDPVTGQWDTRAAIAYPIIGGRDGGYKGYSAIANPRLGSWRVNIKTIDGRLIGRESFIVASSSAPVTLTTETL